MTRFVRVRLDDGTQVSVSREYAEMRGLQILRKPATDRDGQPLPQKRPALRAALTEETPEAAEAATEKE